MHFACSLKYVLCFELKDNGANSITACTYKVVEKSDELLFSFSTNSTVTVIKWSENRIGTVCPLLRDKRGLGISESLKSILALLSPEGRNSKDCNSLLLCDSCCCCDACCCYYHCSLLMLPTEKKLTYTTMCLSAVIK